METVEGSRDYYHAEGIGEQTTPTPRLKRACRVVDWMNSPNTCTLPCPGTSSWQSAKVYGVRSRNKTMSFQVIFITLFWSVPRPYSFVSCQVVMNTSMTRSNAYLILRKSWPAEIAYASIKASKMPAPKGKHGVFFVIRRRRRTWDSLLGVSLWRHSCTCRHWI